MPVHGSRSSYRAGCGCVACRAANAAATASHRAAPVGTVDASLVRAYLVQLAACGIGTRQAATLIGLSRSVVQSLRTGRMTRLRSSTAARILATRPALAHGSTIAGTRTHRFLDSLRREGFTRRELAFRLGAHSHQLQLHRRVTVGTALRVEALHRRLAAV